MEEAGYGHEVMVWSPNDEDNMTRQWRNYYVLRGEVALKCEQRIEGAILAWYLLDAKDNTCLARTNCISQLNEILS